MQKQSVSHICCENIESCERLIFLYGREIVLPGCNLFMTGLGRLARLYFIYNCAGMSCPAIIYLWLGWNLDGRYPTCHLFFSLSRTELRFHFTKKKDPPISLGLKSKWVWDAIRLNGVWGCDFHALR